MDVDESLFILHHLSKSQYILTEHLYDLAPGCSQQKALHAEMEENLLNDLEQVDKLWKRVHHEKVEADLIETMAKCAKQRLAASLARKAKQTKKTKKIVMKAEKRPAMAMKCAAMAMKRPAMAMKAKMAVAGTGTAKK